MKNIFAFIFIALAALSSCESSKIDEGEIAYNITYPNLEVSSFMEKILPEKMYLTFKGNKVKTTIAKGKFFSTEIISNSKTKEIEMRLDFGAKRIFTRVNEEDLKIMMASQPDYELKETGNKDSIIGLLAVAYSMVNSLNDTVTVWFTEQLSPKKAFWFSSYSELKGVPLNYEIERYGLGMQVNAERFISREVLDTEFNQTHKYNEVSFETYEKEVQSLFDILLE
jgi:hypothetical protein